MGRLALGAAPSRAADLARFGDLSAAYPTGSVSVSGAVTLAVTGGNAVPGKQVNITGTDYSITLPTTPVAGLYFWVKKSDLTGGVKIIAPGYGIDGVGSIWMYQESFLIFSDGSNWFTQGRPRGLISAARLSFPTAATSRVLSGYPFGDTELRDIMVQITGWSSANNADGPAFKITRGGSVQSLSYIGASTYNTSATAIAQGAAATALIAPNGTANGGYASNNASMIVDLLLSNVNSPVGGAASPIDMTQQFYSSAPVFYQAEASVIHANVNPTTALTIQSVAAANITLADVLVTLFRT